MQTTDRAETHHHNASQDGSKHSGIEISNTLNAVTPSLPKLNSAHYAVIISMALLGMNQITQAVINHDDWDFLFEAGVVPGYGTPWERTLWEGRWLNYIWYFFSKHLTATLSSLIFITCHAGVAGIISILLSRKDFSGLIALTLFFSPIIADLSRWPTTSTPAMLVLLAMTATIHLTDGFRRHLLAFSAATVLLVASYASLSSIPLILMALRHAEANRKNFSAIILTYSASYLLAVLAIYALNQSYHGHFGIMLQHWREPNPLHHLGDIIPNAEKYYGTLLDVIQYSPSTFLASGLCYLLAFWSKETRGACKTALLTGAFIFCFELLIEIKTGIRVAGRSEVWLWIFAIMPAAFLMHYQKKNILQLIGFSACLIALNGGLTLWADISLEETNISRTLGYFSDEIKSFTPFVNDKVVRVCGDPRSYPGLARMHVDPIRHLQNAMWGAHRIHVEPYQASRCAALSATGIKQTISNTDGHILMMFPDPR
ncbi:hypothetical protein [Methyloparacoccus murrellii]